MKWLGRRTSANIEDRRGEGGFGGFGGTPGGRMVRTPGGRGGKIGGLGLVIVIVLALLFGVDPRMLLTGGTGIEYESAPSGPNAIDDQNEEFVAVVLGDTEEIWSAIFSASGHRYEPPKLVLFDGRTVSGCGAASAAAGPFYCPSDRKAYLDTQFFAVLEQQLDAGGDFARAYVIAHEIAHHVQNQLGVMDQVNQLRSRSSEADANRLSVMLELQADCYSGVWARHAEERFGSLEPGDIEEALNAASRIGDDTLQRNAGQAVVPDSFTHGTSEQRVRWFRSGYEKGDPGACDTFNAARL